VLAARFIVRCRDDLRLFALALSFVVGVTAQAPKRRKLSLHARKPRPLRPLPPAPFILTRPRTISQAMKSKPSSTHDAARSSSAEKCRRSGHAVVKEGHVIFAKRLRYLDREKRKPGHPRCHSIPPRPTFKKSSHDLVLQLVEQGKLDLDKDVTQYLDLPIPPAFGKQALFAISSLFTFRLRETARDLFVSTRSISFSDQYLRKPHGQSASFPPSSFQGGPLFQLRHNPRRYIVQRVSGMPLKTYVQNISTRPSDMKRTTFVQPLPADLLPLMSGAIQSVGEGQPLNSSKRLPRAAFHPALDM